MGLSFPRLKLASGFDWLRGHFLDWLLIVLALAAAVTFVASLLVD